MQAQQISHTLDAQPADVFDAAHWRPLTPDRFLEELGQATCTADEPESLVVTCEGLDDGRVRSVYWAYLKPLAAVAEGHESEVGPYLMSLYEPERGRTVCLVRTNRRLADA